MTYLFNYTSLRRQLYPSRIEGTQTNMDEALMDENEIAPERKDDWKEVNNYVKSLNNAIEQLEKLPISFRLLREIH